MKSIAALLIALAAAHGSATTNLPNPAAIEEVRAGKRTTANAAWWGFDAEDATAALQAAIDSGAKSLTVPYMGEPWIVRPIQLRGNQKIRFEPGVVILAKKGEFQGGGDSLFTANGVSNLTIRGYGATFRMRKRDYQNPPYSKAEWRMGLAIRGCKNVLVEGLRIESSGGDGIYVDGGGDRRWSEDVTIRDCTAHDNHRQGISVISAVNLLVENCRFANTWGTAPEAGIDFEPDGEEQRLVNCVVRNCVFENNHGHEILVYLKPLSTKSEPVSIRFENCLARMTDARLSRAEPGPEGGIQGWAGIAIGAVRDEGPQGLIEFVNCVTEDTGREGIRIYDKSVRGARLRFVNCSVRNPWNAPAPQESGVRVPILIEQRDPKRSENVGGIEFDGCYVYDTVARPAVRFEKTEGDYNLHDVRGRILRGGPGTPSGRFGAAPDGVDLIVAPIEPAAATEN